MDDLISRQAAFEWCRPEEWGTPDERWRPESEYGAMLEALPAAEPRKGKWTPCSEKLPKAEEKVLICTNRGTLCCACYEDGTVLEDDSSWHWYDIDWAGWDEEEDCGIIPEGWWEFTEFHPDCEFNCPVDETVIAWMPLPKPYKGGEE